jgi:hypothetical protein
MLFFEDPICRRLCGFQYKLRQGTAAVQPSSLLQQIFLRFTEPRIKPGFLQLGL